MPIVSTFFGMIIRVYYNEHGIPHFHVQQADQKYVIAIESGRCLSGKIPPRTRKLIEEWRARHRLELLQAWSDAQNHKQPKRIKPLEG